VLLILGSGNRWIIPLVSSIAFAAAVIIVPAIHEYLLSDEQKRALGRLFTRESAANSWENLPAAKLTGSEVLLDAKDAGSGKDAGLPRHRH
jgi:hypothetical protein